MRGVLIKCPNCGANVNSPHTSFVIRCDYCGTQVRVQRRTRFFERVEAPANLTAELAKLPVAIQVHTRRWVVAIIGFVIMMVGLTVALPIMLVVKAASSSSHVSTRKRSGGGQQHKKPDEPRWDGARPILADINGDGTDDVIGRMAVNDGEHISFLAAFDGVTGKQLWISASVGLRSDAIHTAMALTPEAVLVATRSAELFAFGLADGKTRWKIRLGEQIEKLCRGDDEAVVALTADEQRVRVALADGAATPVAELAGCEMMENDTPWRSAGAMRILGASSGGSDLAPDSRAIKGMRVSAAIEWKRGEVNLAVGYKDPGTSIPMFARYSWPAGQRDLADPDEINARSSAAHARGDDKERRRLNREWHRARDALEKRDIEVHWTVQVPGIDPMKAEPRGDLDRGALGVHDDTIGVAYEVKGKGAHHFRLTAFSTTDGKRRWDIGLSGDMPLNAVTVSEKSVLVSRWSSLEAFDVATGEPQFAVH